MVLTRSVKCMADWPTPLRAAQVVTTVFCAPIWGDAAVREAISQSISVLADEMMLTGRQYPASECLAMGLVSRVVPLANLMTTARELAGDMLQCSPTSLAFTRKALYQGLDGTLETAMAFEGFALEKCYVSPEHKEYVAAFLEKRKPIFRKAKG